ncbi:hypothetical protein OBV_27450 [Oscillibacter valericigenes Sjm18-20]|nr:hypothetical protein OBV_27450 [Oscillibacter valericigenes Sjm18-20]
MQDESANGAYYAVITAPVMCDAHLRPRSKLLYGIISFLSCQTGFCYQPNSELLKYCTYIDGQSGEQNSISERTLQSMLSELREHGHIRMDTGPCPVKSGGFKTGRRIFIGQILAPMPSNGKPQTRGEENFTPRKKLHPKGEENCTPYNIRNKKENTPIAPKEVLDAINAYVGDDPEFLSAFTGFLECRAKRKKPLLTERAAHTLISKLKRLSPSREIQIAILDNATEHNWDSVYPLKSDELPVRTQAAPGPDDDRRGRFL